MKRKWDLAFVFGILVTMGAFVSYYTTFVNFPVTRDSPWPNLMMFAGGLGLLGAGLKRAFRDPVRYRGKIRGIVLGLLVLIAFIGFLDLNSYLSAQLPSSDGAPKVWSKTPDFTLPDQNGNPSRFRES